MCIISFYNSEQVTLPERYIGKGNAQSQQSSMKLTELGPRITLDMFKIEQGVAEGDVLYHKFIHKTPEEAAETKARVQSFDIAFLKHKG